MQSLPSEETMEPPKMPTTTSWAGQVDEEESLDSSLYNQAASEDQEKFKEWMKVSKKKKPPQAKHPVKTRSHSGTLKEFPT